MRKMKSVYSGVFRITFFCILRHIFRISQHFALESASTRHVKEFHGINVTQNLNGKRQVYSEFFAFRHMF